jgi:hypothetical protein
VYVTRILLVAVPRNEQPNHPLSQEFF